MDYNKFIISAASEEEQEILIALLSEFPFDSFIQNADSLEAFMPASDDSQVFRTDLSSLLASRNLTYQLVPVPYQNWNAQWESSFQPIKVEKAVLVRAEFHSSEIGFEHEIVISPKMAFGTGHHATTYMMMQKMLEFDLSGKAVLDYGCGTGILAILASKLGAKDILGIDNDAFAIENTHEHLVLNKISNISVSLGELEAAENQYFDVILANINRNVLLADMSALSERLSNNGMLLLSGILEKDTEIIKAAIKNTGMICESELSQNGWMCIHTRKS